MKGKRVLTLFLVLLLVLAGCGDAGDTEKKSSKKKSAGQEAAVDEEDADDADEEDGEGDETDETDPSESDEQQPEKAQDPTVTVIEHDLTCEIEGTKRATGIYPEIVLSEEYAADWPKLKAAIDEANEMWKSDAEAQVGDYAVYAAESANEEYGLGPDTCFSSDLALSMTRADDRIFSALLHAYDFSGGAHPMHGTGSINLDPASGQPIPLSQVLNDTTGMCEEIYRLLREEYPDVADEVSAYAEDGEEGKKNAVQVFEEKLEEDSYTWSLEGDGLHLWFSPYEIASYAAGYSDVTLTYEAFPNLIQPVYQARNFSLSVAEEQAEPEAVEVDPNRLVPTIFVHNPSWDYYCSPDAQPAAQKHITLTKTADVASEWLNTDAWAEEHGFVPASSGIHEDDKYRYVMTKPLEYDYMYAEIEVYEAGTDKLLYDIDVQDLLLGPDEQTGTSSRITQFTRWAQIVDDTLYVTAGHNTYADSEPKSSYIAAIDLKTGNVLWKSRPLTSNAWNFQIVDDTIICGYGFTDEKDYIYLLDRFTGEQVQQIPVRTGPDQFEVVGDTLYVATYNTAYEFAIGR